MEKRNLSIAALVDDLHPITPVRAYPALAISSVIMVLALFTVVWIDGMRPDLLAGTPSEMFLIRSGILALLGYATARSLLAMAQPAVGKYNGGWKIALASAALFPVAGIIAGLTGDNAMAEPDFMSGVYCLIFSLIGGSATAIPMVAALRKGAPTSPERAGWLTGIASGGMGAFAYNFRCPYDSLVYIGFWYSAAVALCAIAGRLIVPRFIRW